MKRKLSLFISVLLSATACYLSSCDNEDTRPTFPLSAEIFHSVDGKQVAFAALTHSANSWLWDFGDGQTSTEKNPVHVYEEGGYYVATLTAKDAAGKTVTKEVTLALELTPYALLTGDHTADDYQGKTWRLSPDHAPLGDYFATADPNLTVVEDTPKPLSTSIFGQLGFGDAYADEFTFHYDGTYTHDVKEDKASFGGVVYQFVLNGGVDVLNYNEDYGLCIAKYTPDENATFTFTENEDFHVESVYGGITFEDAMTLDFSGTEFIGFRDFQRKVVVRSISPTKMQLVLFMAAGQDAEIIGVNTHALILTFEAVN